MGKARILATTVAAVVGLWAAAFADTSRLVVITGPADLIRLELEQIGSSVSSHIAITAERKGNILSLQRQLDECGICSNREEIASQLEYWKSLDATVDRVTTEILESMGFTANTDFRNLTDPNFAARAEAQFEAAESLRKAVVSYCADVLGKEGDDYAACYRDNNENYLNAADKVVRPLCNDYVTRLTGAPSPDGMPDLDDFSDPEKVKQYEADTAAYRKYRKLLDQCNKKYNPLEIIRYQSRIYKENKEIVEGWRETVLELAERQCIYGGKERGETATALDQDIGACVKAIAVDDLATRIVEARRECETIALKQFGFDIDDPPTVTPDGFMAVFNECTSSSDPLKELRDEVDTFAKKYGELSKADVNAYFAASTATATDGGSVVAPASAAGDPVKGATFARRCGVCHNFVKGGPNVVGPNLYGVVGRQVASHPGFNYSDAMRAFEADGKTWDEASLDTYLADPNALVPGNKMAFPGVKADADRANVIAYLKTLAP